MAEVAKPARRATLGSLLLGHNCRQSGLIAGADLKAYDACYVGSDNKVYPATGAAANAAARVRGFAAEAALAAQADAVTLVHGCEVAWNGHGLTPGIDLYLSGTVAGGLATAPSTGGTAPIGYVKDANHFYLFNVN